MIVHHNSSSSCIVKGLRFGSLRVHRASYSPCHQAYGSLYHDCLSLAVTAHLRHLPDVLHGLHAHSDLGFPHSLTPAAAAFPAHMPTVVIRESLMDIPSAIHPTFTGSHLPAPLSSTLPSRSCQVLPSWPCLSPARPGMPSPPVHPAGMQALMKYYNDPKMLAKLSSKLGDIPLQAPGTASTAAAAAAAPEITNLLEAAKYVRGGARCSPGGLMSSVLCMPTAAPPADMTLLRSGPRCWTQGLNPGSAGVLDPGSRPRLSLDPWSGPRVVWTQGLDPRSV